VVRLEAVEVEMGRYRIGREIRATPEQVFREFTEPGAHRGLAPGLA